MKKTLLIFVGLVSIGLSACRKENTFDGPSINEINSKFAILESFNGISDKSVMVSFDIKKTLIRTKRKNNEKIISETIG